MNVEVENTGPAVGFLDPECLFSTTLNNTDNTLTSSVSYMLNAFKLYAKKKLMLTTYLSTNLLRDKRRIHQRSASVRTYTFFTTGFPRFLSIRGARDYKHLIYLYSLTTQTLTMIRLENGYTTLERTIKLSR
jgi:hypothetical protein